MSNLSAPAAIGLIGDIFFELRRYFDEDEIDAINSLLRMTRILRVVKKGQFQWKLTDES